jgi:hypothetical protein
MTQDGDSRDERSCLISSGNRYAIVKFCIWSSASFKAKQRAIDLKLLLNSKSKLHGFDSFEGLPENWLPIVRKAISPHTEKFRRSTTTELLFSRDGSTRLYERINVRQSAP